ncbi:MAG: transketolase [Clostridiales bacterium GWF2_36_10]|nr:MAG: transketolase [Clostridiales bacterium GWF2_36_10]HAN21532.1 transketolase [Clostridiales bacterium]
MEREKLLCLDEAAAKIRLLSLEAVFNAESGHPGGSLSIAEIIAYLYFEKMNVDPKNPQKSDRDRLVLSKGHTCPALYSALAIKGFFPEEEIKTFRQLGSRLQGHPDMNKLPGVDMTTGSLGQGISAACGMALKALKSGYNYKVFAIIGDGESQEGQVWEAAMFAAHYKLKNLIAFLDFNHLQIDGDVRDVMNPTPLDEKFAAFGWFVQVIDGHNLEEIDKAVNAAYSSEKPSIIICNTVKGKGVSFMENKADWHGKAPKKDENEIAVAELEAAYKRAMEVRKNG